MKAQKGMIWKVTVKWKDEECTYETDGHIGKFIKTLQDLFKDCEIVERWQEPLRA